MEYPLFRHPLYSISLSNKIAQLIHLEDLDIIHAHYAIPHSICGYLGIKISKKENVKLITTLHGTDISLVGKDESYKNITRFSLEESDGITAVSNSLKDETIDIFKVDKEINVIYNFIDPIDYKELKLQKEEDKKYVIHISNFREVKNIDILIKAFYLAQRKVKAELILVGEGPETAKAQRLALDFGLKDKIHFMGKQDTVLPLLSRSDLFLLPSKKESFGLVALEAMGCKLPVIASNIGGLPEVIQDGITGRLYDPEDAEGMAEGIIELLTQEELRNQMGVLGQERAFKHFNSKDIVKQYEDLYYKVLNP
jgi:N-acetyl-alpha-D-glucosaminyl L-malate synthase BshA